MKRLFETVSRWLSNRRETAAQADGPQSSLLPEHERRLRDMEKSGRTLFLP
jgi:hypothetical protein